MEKPVSTSGASQDGQRSEKGTTTTAQSVSLPAITGARSLGPLKRSNLVKLKRVTVTNHTRVADLDIEVRDHLVLVGPNNAGKSALLRCLELLLGSSTAQLYQQILSADFRDPAEPLEILAELGELSDDGKALFPDELDTSTGTLTVKLVASLDAAENLSITRTGPDGGTQRQLSREQIAGIGWRLLGATGLSRDLRRTAAALSTRSCRPWNWGRSRPTSTC